MRQRDILFMAFGSLRANLLRSALTMLGITIGVFSVVGVMTALGAMNQSINTGLAVLGANSFQITRFPAVNVGGPGSSRMRFRNRPPITYAESTRFKALLQEQAPGSIVTLGLDDMGETVSYGGATTQPRNTITGTDETYLETNNFKLASGRFITPEDVLYARPYVVIGEGVRKELFPAVDPIGEWVTAGGGRFQIIGVLEERGAVFGNSLDDLLLVPITRWLAVFGGNRSWWRSVDITVQSPSKEQFAETQELATGMMRRARNLEPDEENNFEIFSNDSLQNAFAQIATIVGLGGIIISSIALMTAGVGIMNIMLVSVTERTREIGVRKSLGAKRLSILLQFLLEAVFLCLVGGVVGIILGAGAGNAAALMLDAGVILPWDWAIISLVVCTMIGLGFGLYPAWKAARLDPIEALRYE